MAALGDKTSSSMAFADTVITAQTGTEITLQSGSAVVATGNLAQFDDRKGRVRWFCTANQSDLFSCR